MTPQGVFAENGRRLRAGELEAVFLPDRGMLGVSLRHRGVELLRRIDDLEAAAAKGSTAGIPLLHPWANRLAGLRYCAAGREVVLDASSPLLHLDGRGLPIHGVPWARVPWTVTVEAPDRLTSRLEWDGDLLPIFPFRHRMEMNAALGGGGLTVSTTLVAGGEGSVPVSFGFHPYFGLPGARRTDWRLEMPAMRRLGLDAGGLPDGSEEPVGAEDGLLGARVFDDLFALESGPASFGIAAAGRRITVEFLEGYRFAQVYVPPGQDFVALEPMTAPTNALVSGRGLHVVEPGGSFVAVFRVRIEGGAAEEVGREVDQVDTLVPR